MSHKRILLQAAISAAVTGGNILLAHSDDARRRFFHAKESFRDVVTPNELYAEKKIIEELGRNNKYPIVAEESHISAKPNLKGTYWLVDPLDGTVNYVHRVPFYCVSISFIEKGLPSIGVIFNPLSQELFYGAKGIGVYKNDKGLNVNDRNPELSLFAVSFSGKQYEPSTRDEEFLSFARVNDASMGCLRTGSAAMNLAYLAEGRLGGCWGKANKWWDIAGGLLLAQLSGARIEYTIIDESRWLVSYFAAVPSSWESMRKKVIPGQ